MKLLVDRLNETPTSHHFRADPAWWPEVDASGELAELLEQPPELEVEAHKMGEDLYLQGSIRGELSLTCGRCLARYRQPLRESFRLVLEPAGHRVPADPEAAAGLARDGLYLGDELETGWFQGSEVDLGTFVREMITLLVPVQPVCRPECQGLCPRCGVDRNNASCECAEVAPSSPFAVLQALRDDLPGGGKP